MTKFYGALTFTVNEIDVRSRSDRRSSELQLARLENFRPDWQVREYTDKDECNQRVKSLFDIEIHGNLKVIVEIDYGEDTNRYKCPLRVQVILTSARLCAPQRIAGQASRKGSACIMRAACELKNSPSTKRGSRLQTGCPRPASGKPR